MVRIDCIGGQNLSDTAIIIGRNKQYFNLHVDKLLTYDFRTVFKINFLHI